MELFLLAVRLVHLFIANKLPISQKQLLETKEAIERQRKSLKKRQLGKFLRIM